MDDLLLLAHRIPYPPDKGDKIRSYHLLRGLAGRYRVHVGAFVDDPDDWRHARAVAELAGGECLLRPLHPWWSKLRAWRGLGRGLPLTVPIYHDPVLAAWVTARLAAGTRLAVAFSSAMAQYLLPHAGVRWGMDFVDVDSQKWVQYGASRSGPAGWLYRREGRTLLAYERRAAAAAGRAWLVTEAEAALLRVLAPEVAARVAVWENGVDADYFSPERSYPDPYPAGGPVLVFTGAMDYWANVDAMRWFVEAVWPQVRVWQPQARLAIVGARPSPAVWQLGRRPGVLVTGSVPDTRPYLAHAAAAIAPLRIAQGVQNKVLEAMSMGKPVLVSGKAVQGICACPGVRRWVSDDAESMAQLAVELLEGAGVENGNRACVLAHYRWERNVETVLDFLAA